jgi:hypothetical protein
MIRFLITVQDIVQKSLLFSAISRAEYLTGVGSENEDNSPAWQYHE